jgi:hypothetical protein
MSKTVFYKKVGRKYVPVSEYDSELNDSFTKGNHLVMCYPGGQSTRYNIDPALAPMIAAGRYAQQSMLDSMRDISEARPKTKPITDEQRQAWRVMKKAFGDEFFAYSYPSNVEIAQAGINAMMEEANKLMTHPAVKDQYEKFLMTCELVREESSE